MQNISAKLKLNFNKAKKALMEAEKICIISHRGPDGDAVGSNLALRAKMEELGKTVVSACVDPVPADTLYLKGSEDFVDDFDPEDFDMFVSVDCGALGLVKFNEKKPEIINGDKPFLNIDHHESNDGFGTINIVDTDSCATCFILFNFFEFCQWPLDRTVATYLLHGIYFDTGSLMHANTTTEVYEVCGKLFLKGADLRSVSKHLFHTMPVSRMRLLGRILERTNVNDENVTISAVNQDDYRACESTSKDTSGAVDFLNMVPGANYCVLLSENEKGIVKGSLRTRRDDVNLSDVASQWGGGGHPKASGFGISGKLTPLTKWRVCDDENQESGCVEF